MFKNVVESLKNIIALNLF